MSERILISRTDSIGDVVLTLPLAGAIKAYLPEAKVIFLGRNYTKDIVALSKHVDEFVSWDDQERLDKKSKIEWLKSIQADTIVHVFPKLEIARLAFKAKIPKRIGSTGRIYHYQYCNKLVPLSRKNSDLHESQLNLLLLRPLIKDIGSPTLNEIYSFSAFIQSEEVSQKAKDLIDPDKFNLILHPKSKGSARDWPLERYSELIGLLTHEKYKVFISGTAEEAKLLDTFLTENKEKITDITGAFSLKEFIQFIGLADGLVAASTGPLHIAAALNKVAIGIYPPIRPMHPGRWAPLGQKADYLVIDKKCDDCRKAGACHCMADVTAQQVMNKLENYVK